MSPLDGLAAVESGSAHLFDTQYPVMSSKSRWTAREAEFLAVTLRLLQQHGYDGLTMEAVAVDAKSSKATLYRHWQCKADLVLAAFLEGTRMTQIPRRSGSLRQDLLQIGKSFADWSCQHASTVRAILPEVSRNPALNAALENEFGVWPKLLVTDALVDAADRGEVDASLIVGEVCDLLHGYILFRYLVSRRPPTAETIRALVDDVLIPSLTQLSPEKRINDLEMVCRQELE